MAYACKEEKKLKDRKYYIRTRKNNAEFKKWKKEYDREFHKGYKNPNLTKERSRAYTKKYKESHLEEVQKKDREHKRKTYARCKEINVRWRDRNSEKVRVYRERYKEDGRTKAAREKYRYGISPEEVQKLLEDQNFSCAVCRKPFTATRKRYIDHCHTTNKVRGLVHMECNTLMGLAKDDPELLERAAVYLRRFRDE